jgi:hypothetical protein
LGWKESFSLLHVAFAMAINGFHVYNLHHLLSCYPNSWNNPNFPVVCVCRCIILKWTYSGIWRRVVLPESLLAPYYLLTMEAESPP